MEIALHPVTLLYIYSNFEISLINLLLNIWLLKYFELEKSVLWNDF